MCKTTNNSQENLVNKRSKEGGLDLPDIKHIIKPPSLIRLKNGPEVGPDIYEI